MAAIKDKLVELVAINLSKKKYGNPSKKAEFVIEAEYMLKDILLRVLMEKKNGDPLEYITFLENVQELCDLDYYDVWFIEQLVFGD